jgi:hypothetical protein
MSRHRTPWPAHEHVALLLCFPCLLQNEEDAYRKMRLRVEDVQGRNCLTNFWVSACVRMRRARTQLRCAMTSWRAARCCARAWHPSLPHTRSSCATAAVAY